MAQVHTPQGPSLFWATLAPHASASVPIKCPAYKNIFPVRLLQTLNRGRHGKILGLTPGTRSEDQLLPHLPCSCIIPAPSYSTSMVHVTPPSSCLQEHQHLQDTSSNLVEVSTLPTWAPLLCSGFHPRSLFCGSETRYAAWLARSSFFSLPHLHTA